MFISPPQAGNQSCLTVPLSGWSYDTCQVKKVNPLGVPWWCHVGAMLVPCWCHVGAMLVPCWCHVGAMLVPCWCHVGAMLVPCWCHVGAMLVPCWCHVGAMLVPCWCHVGAMLVPCWCHSKMAPTWHPLYYAYKKYERSRSGYWLYSTTHARHQKRLPSWSCITRETGSLISFSPSTHKRSS